MPFTRIAKVVLILLALPVAGFASLYTICGVGALFGAIAWEKTHPGEPRPWWVQEILGFPEGGDA